MGAIQALWDRSSDGTSFKNSELQSISISIEAGCDIFNGPDGKLILIYREHDGIREHGGEDPATFAPSRPTLARSGKCKG
jgi:hypothetical protein